MKLLLCLFYVWFALPQNNDGRNNKHYTDFLPDYQSPTELLMVDKIEYGNSEMLVHFRQTFQQDAKIKLKYRFGLIAVSNPSVFSLQTNVLSPHLNHKLLKEQELLNYHLIKKGDVFTCTFTFKALPDSIKAVHLLRGKDKYVFKFMTIKTHNSKELGNHHSLRLRLHKAKLLADKLKKDGATEKKDKVKIGNKKNQDDIDYWTETVNNLRTEGCKCGDKVQKGGLQDLEWNEELYQAAYKHAKDMAEQGYFNHIGKNGSKFWDRTKAASYANMPRGENIFKGGSTNADAFWAWKESPGHCLNMMMADANEFAVANFNQHYVMILGKK